jgi:malate permease and related proteins
MLIVEKMLVFLILILVGWLLAKVKIVDDHTSRTLTSIVLYVANPALILMSSQTEHTISNSQLLISLLIAVAMFTILIAVGAVLPKIFKLEQSQSNAYAMMIVFSNIGYMGIPLVTEIIGVSALLYVTVFILLFNILVYTYGIMILQRGTLQAVHKQSALVKFLNPGVISGVIAVALYLLHIRLPEVLTLPLGYLSDLTSPVSMMIIGAALANVKILSLFTDWKLLVFSAVKLLVLPVLGGLLLRQLVGVGDLLGVCIVMLSTPVGSVTVMMGQQYGGDMKLMSKGVLLTTLLCIATIPAVFAVLL